jgi:very-short-patch-repair endonuclease
MAPRRPTALARRLRRDATDAARLLWQALRERLAGSKIRRQHPIGRHIADFACPSCKLAIELDGGQHATRARTDAVRSASLAGEGYRVIRFWNNDVLGNVEGVLDRIARELAAAPTSPRPSPPQGGEGV